MLVTGDQHDIAGTNLIRMPEPRGPLLLAAHQRDPFPATPTESFPHIRVAFHPPRLSWRLKGLSGGGADPVGEALVVPEGRVL